MKKSLIVAVILGLTTSTTLMAEEMSQFEALQQLNIVSGKLIRENEQLKKDVALLKKSLKLQDTDKNSIDKIEGNERITDKNNLDKNTDKRFIDLKSSIDAILQRLDVAEEKLRVFENDKREEKRVENSYKPTTSAPRDSFNSNYKSFAVSSTYLNLRDEPNINSRIVTRYKKGTVLLGIELGNGWIQVLNQKQYLSKKYLNEIKQ